MRLAMLFFFLSMLLISPERCADAARRALALWSLDVVPSLFPYMVLCRLCSKAMQSHGVPALTAVPILGLLGGSPGGAAALSAYSCDQGISKRSFHALCSLTGGISPAFLLSTMRSWGLSAGFCRALMIVCLLSAILSSVFVFFWPKHEEKQSQGGSTPRQIMEQDPIVQSVMSVLGVGGCLVFFSVAAEWGSILLGRFLPPLFQAIIHALLETAGGMHKLCGVSLTVNARFILCAFLAGFSGVSILMQNHQQLGTAGLSIRQLLGYSLIRGWTAAFLALILTLLPL